MKSLEVCGLNDYFGINEKSNNKNKSGISIIYPPLLVRLNNLSINSYSTYLGKTVIISSEHVAYGIGDNSEGQISFSLPLQVINHFTKINLNDTNGRHLYPQSAVCGYRYTLYLASTNNNNKNCQNKLVYSNSDLKTKSLFVLDTSGQNPVSLFGGSSNCAAIDSEGGIFFINETIFSTFSPPRYFLPDGEKAVSVACCNKFVISLSSSGRTFYSKSDDKLSFIEIPELKGNEIICISGVYEHCFAVCKDGRVFVRGSNDCGRLGIVKNSVDKFTEILSLRDCKIVAAFAGPYHSIFQSSTGKFYSCGDNSCGELLLSSGLTKEKVHTPELMTISNVSFIVAGRETTSFFKNHVPTMSPNRKICLNNTTTNEPMKLPKPDKSSLSSSSEISSLKSQIQKLMKQVSEEQKKQKELKDEFAMKEKEFKKQKEELEKQLESKMKEINTLKQERSKNRETKVSPHSISTPSIKILSSQDMSCYEKVEEISDGSSGRVYKVSKQIFYAMKVMKISKNKKEMQYFLGEYEILNMLDHPNIEKAFGLFIDPKNPPSILLEFCPETLDSKVKEGSLSNINIVFYIYQIIEGMKYVHFRGVIHRDLKPTNILISNEGTIKICDFGISKLMTTEEQTMTYCVGTKKFMAPEIIEESEDYNEKVDVYSFGVLVFYVLSGGELPKIKIGDILRGKKAMIPSKFSNFAKQLIDECWNFEPKDRPSFSDILNKLEENDYKLVELDKSEIKQVVNRIKEHKEKIPKY